MSGDKEIDDQIDMGAADDFEGDDFASEDFSDDMTEEGFDDQSFDDGEDFGDEDWESYDDEGYEDDGGFDAEKAAKSKRFNQIVIAGAVVIALGVGGMKIMGGTPQNAPAGQIQGQQVADFQADPGMDQMADAPQQNNGIMGSPENMMKSDAAGTETTKLPMPETVEGIPPMPAPISTAQQEEPPTGLMPMPEDTMTPSEPPVNDMAAASQGQNTEMLSDMSAMDDSMDDTMSAEDPFAISPLDTEGQDAADHQSVALSANDDAKPVATETAQTAELSGAAFEKLDTILSRLDSLENELENVQSLKDDIAALEKRVNKLAQTKSTTRSTSTKSSYTTAAPNKPAATRTNTATKWVLKSAQPGQAMVAREGQGDMITVRVGETLAGIGRVESVSVVDGRWTVQGTNGKVTQ